MAVCAAYNSQHSQDAGALGLGIVTLGLLGTLGNVVCCLTSIVLFMPTLSILEGVHTRSELEIIAFCKLAFFQTMGVVLSTLYVFSLDEESVFLQTLSSEQFSRMGSGPLRDNAPFRFLASTPSPTPAATLSPRAPHVLVRVYVPACASLSSTRRLSRKDPRKLMDRPPWFSGRVPRSCARRGEDARPVGATRSPTPSRSAGRHG